MRIKRLLLVISMLLFFVLLQASAFSETVMVTHTIRYELVETWAGDMAKYAVYDNDVLSGYMIGHIQPPWFVENARTYQFPEKR